MLVALIPVWKGWGVESAQSTKRRKGWEKRKKECQGLSAEANTRQKKGKKESKVCSELGVQWATEEEEGKEESGY